MPWTRQEILCTAYCGCGHCCGWEWGLTLPGARYLALGDWHAPVGTKHPLDLHSIADKLPRGHPLAGLKGPLASLSQVMSLRPKHFTVKRRIIRGGCRPGLFCKYWTQTAQRGQPYEGITSMGTLPSQARAPLLSTTAIKKHPLHLAARVLAPWTLVPQTGTIAADTRHFPFGTKMLVPGYGWAEVQDKGSLITGPVHVDLYHHSHDEALKWGKKTVKVVVVPPGKHPVDHHGKEDGRLAPLRRLAHDAWSLLFGVHHVDEDGDGRPDNGCNGGHQAHRHRH